MHYIRLLRPALVNAANPDSPVVTLKLTITTDLGDAFLSPPDDAPVKLHFRFEAIHGRPGPLTESRQGLNDGTQHVSLKPLNGDGRGFALWKANMRVLKVDLRAPRAITNGSAAISVDVLDGRDGALVSARQTAFLLPWRAKEYGENQGLIAPLKVQLTDGQGADVAIREFQCQHTSKGGLRTLQVEEEIGESIARHIWDAGLVTAALVADGCCQRPGKKGQRVGFLRIDELLPIDKETTALNVLELGCGVGVLGIAIATFIYDAAKSQQAGLASGEATVLLTDLPEAEERARANIARFQSTGFIGEKASNLLYENLDWEDGAEGRFGPLITERFWNYIVLSDCTYNVDSFPVLVGTLSALHTHNLTRASVAAGEVVTTKVVLSTKPRHDSEKALFDLLEGADWTYRLIKSLPLPSLNGVDEVVEVYCLEKSDRSGQNSGESSKKRKTEEQDHQVSRPGKRAMGNTNQ
ncbi:hypothetical protein JX265_002202 [Neoarthrinium moseri]|uniref:Uncharacterized protein n=1 Tax=Neoarthrinium moseri TaxID=1658444 RepID=A0A9P9WUE4_9PEZI|nr:uncharacterized protein JN550_007511 [Neoarthrinium moseri]KAI1850304.1 hypothetical protein JX266_004162 [Neoarthrinium moseri]KAI1866658.1 hypothetical protein JN550_007511 [Neoarthrinium moseri]KAI1879248.1 hypothetical protein JX265_002202 [Neoarthrinium moseri]